MKLLILLAVTGATNGVVACAQSGQGANGLSRVPRMEIFVLPTGYRGPFLAIYGQAQAPQPIWRGDTAFYDVPPGGVVRVPYPEPPRSTRTSHVFANEPKKTLGNYSTCEDMRVHLSDPTPGVCWFGHSVGGTGIPDHIVAVVTSWAEIPANFNRTSFVYDSVLFQGKRRMDIKWEEPPEILQRLQSQRTQ